MIQMIAIIICGIGMCVSAITGNIALTVMNGVLVLMNVIFSVSLNR